MLVQNALLAAIAVHRLADALDRVASVRMAQSADHSLADAVLRGQMPKLLDALKRKQG